LYATRDLATDKYRLENYKPNLIVNEVGAEQSLYFKQLYKIEELLGWYTKDERIHVKHGLFRLKEGKMSTRKGNVIWLEDVLEEAILRASHLGEKNMVREISGGVVISRSTDGTPTTGYATSINNRDSIAIGAIKWNDLKHASHFDVTFDWDEVLNMQGNSGPYMQYAYVRCQSILAKEGTPINSDVIFTTSVERLIARKLIRFNSVVEDAAKNYAPHTLCNYLFDIAQEFSRFYEVARIKDAEDTIKNTRLTLVTITAEVIKKGLAILGIQTVNEM
jgi:arginyl-tRNA synthetase